MVRTCERSVEEWRLETVCERGTHGAGLEVFLFRANITTVVAQQCFVVFGAVAFGVCLSMAFSPTEELGAT